MTTEPEHLATATEMDPSSLAAGDGQRERGRIGKRGAPQAFARKLAEILATESTETISWNANGSAFQVHDVERFSEDILTKYYRHSKFSSFQRQLNLYSFRKIVKGADAGGYAHPMFRRDRPDDLYHVRRSISGSGRYEPAAASAKATAKRNAASKAASLKLMNGGGGEWAPPRAHKSGAAARRVGKLRNKVTGSSTSTSASTSIRGGTVLSARMVADHQRQQSEAAAGGAGGPGARALLSARDAASSDAGERSPWTSGESSDSDASIKEARAPPPSEGEQEQQQQRQARQGHTGSSDENDEAEACSSDSDGDGEARRAGGPRRHERTSEAGAVEHQQHERIFPSGEAADNVAGGDTFGDGEELQQKRGEEADGDGAPPARKSPFNFFKKTFGFMERSSSHKRIMSTSSVDMTTTAATTGLEPSERPGSSSSTSLGSSHISELMVDTSAAARAAAAGIRPPPVTATGGGHRIPMDPSTAAGNKTLISSPLTPKSSMEAAALAAAAATAMPPPPKREQREELGLVEQLTNMVEVFDICDLMRKVSASNSCRLDKHGGIMKPAGGGGHLRNMSVDTDQGMPQSPLEGIDGQGGGQSPMGLGSLASMELVRDASKDWDILMAGSADVGDLSNTMVQSVAEFFSF